MALKHYTKRRIAVTVTISAVALCVVLLMNLCSSPASDRSADSTEAIDSPETADPADILSRPLPFDAQTVAETASMVTSGRQLSAAEAARAVMVAESAVNHLGRILEDLTANDDPADTWNVMTELASLGWAAQTTAIIGALQHTPLGAAEGQRLDEVSKAASRNAGMVAALQAGMTRRLPDIFR